MKAIVTCIPCDVHNKRAAIASLKTTPDVGFHRTYGHTAAISSWPNLRFKPGFSVSSSPRLGEEWFTASLKMSRHDTKRNHCCARHFVVDLVAAPVHDSEGLGKAISYPDSWISNAHAQRNNKIFDIVGIARKTSKCLGTKSWKSCMGYCMFWMRKGENGEWCQENCSTGIFSTRLPWGRLLDRRKSRASSVAQASLQMQRLCPASAYLRI